MILDTSSARVLNRLVKTKKPARSRKPAAKKRTARKNTAFQVGDRVKVTERYLGGSETTIKTVLSVREDGAIAVDRRTHRGILGGKLEYRGTGGVQLHRSASKYITRHAVQGNYGRGYEDLVEEDIAADARDRLKEYRENEPGTPFRLITRRVLRPKSAVVTLEEFWRPQNDELRREMYARRAIADAAFEAENKAAGPPARR